MSRPRPPKLTLYAPGMRLLEPDGIRQISPLAAGSTATPTSPSAWDPME